MTPLKKPLTHAEIRRQQKRTGTVKALLSFDLVELLDMDRHEFHNLVVERIVGKHLMLEDLHSKLVGHLANQVYIEITANASRAVNLLEAEKNPSSETLDLGLML